jgi:hypothetical protein
VFAGEEMVGTVNNAVVYLYIALAGKFIQQFGHGLVGHHLVLGAADNQTR